MTIYMKLSKKEVRRICLTNSFWDVRKARSLLIIVLIFTILTTLALVIMYPADILTNFAFVGIVAYVGAIFAGFRLLKSWKAVFCYWKKNTGNVSDFVETGDDGISCFSNDLLSVYPWSTVLDVYETKNFYFIATSKESRLAVPRRCFADQSQLDAFVTLLKNRVAKKRLHLKNYPIGVPAPDFVEEVVPTPPQENKEEILEKPAVGDELFALRFVLRAKNFYSHVFWEYFTSKTGSEMTITGLLFSAAFMFGIFNGSIRQGDNMVIFMFSVFLIAGLFLLLFGPIQIVLNIIKGIGKSSIHSSEMSYRFYKDSYLVETSPENTSLRVYWNDLVEIKESPHAYFLYDAKSVVNMIPKRAFADAKDKKEMLKALLRDARSQMKKDDRSKR